MEQQPQERRWCLPQPSRRAYTCKSHVSGFIYSVAFAPLPPQHVWKGEQGIISRCSAIYVYNLALLTVTLPNETVVPHWHPSSSIFLTSPGLRQTGSLHGSRRARMLPLWESLVTTKPSWFKKPTTTTTKARSYFMSRSQEGVETAGRVF